MFQYLRKAVSGVQVRDNSRDNLVRDEYQKKKIKEYLASAIKQLQKTYVSSSSEYIIERNDECAQSLCIGLEAVFLHGLADHGNSLQTGATLRSMFSEGITSSEDDYDQEIATKAFWEIVKEVTHSDVITQLKHLVVTTDVGLSRAWIRLALNDGLIISYLDAILADSSHLRKYYGQNAFLMDRELPGILKELLQGLANFQFRLNYNSSKLNSWDVLPLQLAGHIQHTETRKSSDSTDGKLFTANTTERLKDIETKNDMTDPPLSPVAVNVSEEIKAEPTEQGMSSVTPLSSTPAQPLEVQESQHGSSAISLSLSKSLGSTSAPHENANTQNIPSLSNSLSNYSPATQQRIAGNQLSGQGWEGWSSSFENDSAKNLTRKNSAEDEKLKSFGSLLQKYGHNGVAENEECLFDESKNRPALSTIITQSCCDGENEKMVGVHSPAANDPNLARMNFEVVPSSTSTQGQFLDQRDGLSVEQLTSINSEQGLDKQNFQCKGCAKPIGLIYGPYRVCYFDGGYYCSDCHDEEEHLIPARVIQNWDFKRYKVSKDSKISLMKIEEEPLFHVDEANPFLYDVIMDLREVKVLRIQLQHIKGYIHTCRQEIIEDFRRRLWPREYLAEDIHQYSLLDLVQIKNGQLAHHLKKVIQQFTKHIFKCNLCCQKGFICEYCNDKTIIYPFQVNIAVQCSGCLSVFHKKCRQDKRCPKCVRIHLRHQNRNMDLKLSVTQKEQYIGRDIL